MCAKQTLLLTLCTVVLAGTASAETEVLTQAIPVELRTYDVSDIVTTPTDFPAPDLSLTRSMVNIVDPFAAVPAQQRFSAADLVTLIHDRMFPAAFADPSTSIAEQSGSLVIVQRVDIHRQITQYLSTLRKAVKLQVVVKGLLIPSAEIPQATIFDSAALAKVLGPRGKSAALAAPRVICCNAQRVHTVCGQAFNYIRDYDVAGAVYDPVVSTALEGCVFETRPLVSNDHKTVDCDLNFTFTTNLSKNEQRNILLALPVSAATPIESPVSNDASSSAVPAKSNEAPNGGATEKETPPQTVNKPAPATTAVHASLPIEVPSMSTQKIRTTLRVPADRWVLAGVLNNPDREAKESKLLFLVAAELAEDAPAGKAAKADGARDTKKNK